MSRMQYAPSLSLSLSSEHRQHAVNAECVCSCSSCWHVESCLLYVARFEYFVLPSDILQAYAAPC